MTLKHPYQAFMLLCASLLLAACSGCAQLGLPTAQTFNEKMAVAYGSVTQVRETATVLLQQKKITADDAANVLQATDVARTGLDTARKIHAVDPSGASAKLDSIRTGLSALAAYLAARGGT